MSLINQMLRDLNARHAGEVTSALPGEVRPLPEASRATGTTIETIGATGASRITGRLHRDTLIRAARIGVMGLFLLAAGWVGVWGWSHRGLQSAAPSSTPPVEVAAAAPPTMPSDVSRLSALPPSDPDHSSGDTPPDLPVVSSIVPPATVTPEAHPLPLRKSRTDEGETRPSSPSSVAKRQVTTVPLPLSQPVPTKEKHAMPPPSVMFSTEKAATISPGLRLEDALIFTPGRPHAVPSRSAPEKKAGNESQTLLVPDEKIVLTRRDSSGREEKAEKIEPKENNLNPGSVKIEKIDRADRGDEAYREGVMAYQQGRLRDAVIQLQSSLRENPRHVQARQALLGIYMEYKRHDDAIILLRVGLEEMPSQAGWAMTLARIQVDRGQQTEAWATLEKYQVAGERNADYQGFAAVVLQNLGRPHEAVLRYRAALRLKPREGRWWFALGSALEADNQRPDAIEAYRQAQSLGGLTPAMNDVLLSKLR